MAKQTFTITINGQHVGKRSIVTVLPDGGLVETWRGRRGDWTTARRDADGNQIGEAWFTGNRKGARADHDARVRQAISEGDRP